MITKIFGACSSYNVRLLVFNERNLYSSLYSFLFFFLCSLLSGCALFTTKVPVIVETSRIKAGENKPSVNFEIIGRILVQSRGKVFTGGVRWSHINTDDSIMILSPFGQTLVEIKSNKDYALLTTREQKNHISSNVEELTKQVIGWKLPLLGMQYWVRGVNSPRSEAELDRDKNGYLIEIRQDGWKIKYSDYTSSQLDQIGRPRELVLEHSNIKIKLIIDNWIVK
tara:strand:- start:1105 stop:1779 length:675 start_codon:yes stop_codon:yes gene_type:complete